MPGVSIVTDSTAYLPDELLKQFDVTVIPLSIIWDGKSYRDGIDIQPEEFYERLAKSESLPTTSQITAPDFQDAFERILQGGNSVLGIFLSSGFSGTYEAALQAREAMQNARDRIAIVDSRLTTMAMGLPVLAAARAAMAGEDLAACRVMTEQACARSGVLFVVDTLEFLRRGGRIGGAQALLGSVLNIKPILAMQDGKIVPVEKIRTRSAALARVLELVVDRIGDRTPVRLATSHSNCETDASSLLAAARAELNPMETFCRPLSPVIGAHVGPGTVALAYMAGIA